MRVGVLGGGQLGQMLVLAGYPLGIKTTCYDSSIDVPASLVGNVIAGSLQDTQKLHRWASHVDVITYEWENYPAELVADLSESRPVHPGTHVLASMQDRWAEKRLLDELAIPVTPFRLVRNERELVRAIEELDTPLVLKTRTGGYDGKGQVVIRDESDLAAGVALTADAECIAEQWVPFDRELSVIGARGLDGDTVIYPLVENVHRNGILRTSLASPSVDNAIADDAERYMFSLLERLQYVGVLALEMFEVSGRLLGNEMAPRVHNSGHWTIEGATTSQFENHLRAITGMPLGSAELRCPSAMVNLIGDIPAREEILDIPGAHLHVYGKDPRPGRKVGHVTITALTDEELHERLDSVRKVVDDRLRQP